MIELKCQNCSSSDIEYREGLLICQNCGSRFVAEPYEKQIFDKEERLEDEVVEAFNMWDEYDNRFIETADDEYLDMSLEWSGRLSDCVEKLLKFNPLNPYGWTIMMVERIGYGLSDEWKCKLFFEYAEKAADNLKPGEKEDLIELLRENYCAYCSDIARKYPEFEEDANRIREKIKKL